MMPPHLKPVAVKQEPFAADHVLPDVAVSSLPVMHIAPDTIGSNGVAVALQSPLLAHGSVEETICKALSELHTLGIHEALRIHVALFSNYTHIRSPGFQLAVKTLKSDGLIEDAGRGRVRLTERGHIATPLVHPPHSNEETLHRIVRVIQRTCGKRGGGAKAGLICELLSDGQCHCLTDIMKQSGYKNARSTGFNKVLAILTNYGLLERTNGKLKLTDVCFPYGRPSTVAVLRRTVKQELY
ncbi:hypothetical protein MPSEU_000749000 [Mayamaea pseudoterrestris]|nr:hypothetical protein MPSEU_000749000 [Mayamaea pseudoterrestris]